MTNFSFKITFWFRIGNYLKSKKNYISKTFYLFVYLILRHYQYLTGIQLSIGTEIGGGLTFGHFSDIVIHPKAIIGKNCTIYQGVTIGSMRNEGVPIIGNNCIFFPGTRISGKVKIGNNVVAGANSVIINDIPDNSVVVGAPARVVNTNSKKIINLYL